MMDAVDSLRLMKMQWLVWAIVGVNSKNTKWKKLYFVYSVIVIFLMVFFLPLHFFFGIFNPEGQKQKLQLIAVAVSAEASSIKLLSYIRNYGKIRKMELHFRELDKNIKHFEDTLLFQDMCRKMKKIDFILFTVTGILLFNCISAIIFQTNRTTLLYSGWLPFDYRVSTLNYNIAKYYQCLGIIYASVQNVISDRFSIMAFFLISEHTKFLHKRISRIGHCKNSQTENEKDFQNCINAQQCLYDLCYQIEDIVAFPLFLQFTVTGITTCLAMSVALFFVEDTFTRLYFTFYVICVLMGLFPVCYMGSELEHAFEQLHWSIYYSDWINQSTAYKKDMLIFNERALKQRAFLAGGIFRIHLQTFLSTCKGAYSMFAVVLRFKNE